MSDVPEFINPLTIAEMTPDAVEKLTESIRHRRLNAVRVYEQAQAAAQELADEKARKDMHNQARMLKKQIDTIDKQIEKIDARVNKIRALRLQLGLDG